MNSLDLFDREVWLIDLENQISLFKKSGVLIVVFILIFCGCTKKISEDEICNIIERLENEDGLEYLLDWRIKKRSNNSSSYFFKYQHGDSSEFLYNKLGNVIDFSRYHQIGFGLRDRLDTLYMFKGKRNVSFEDGIYLISVEAQRDAKYVERSLNVAHTIFQSNFVAIQSFPSVGCIAFGVNDNVEIFKFLKPYSDLDLTGKGFIKISDSWYYKVSNSESE